MARRGVFGRLPRTAPNLTSTIVSIAREMQNERDSILMDAWRNGGTFDGKPVTDAMVLAYWQAREKSLDPADPLAERAKDNILQLTYAIEQSKMDLLHVQGKLSDTGYAKFFLKWSHKVPRNSEFWRTLQKDAAQLLESAKARGAASSARRKTEAFNAFVKDQQADAAIADQMTAALQNLSKATGLSVTGNGDQLLALLSQDYALHPDQYHALRDALRTADPNFAGTFTSAYFAQHLSQADTAYGNIANRAYKDGYSSAYKAATENQAAMSEWGQNAHVWSVAKSYESAYAAYSKVWNDPNASEADRMKAATDFAAVAQRLSTSPGIDSASQLMLQADAKRAVGQDAGDLPSFGQAMIGHTGVTTDAQQQFAYMAQKQQLAAGSPGSYVYAAVGKDGNFDATGKGAIGLVPASSVPAGAQFVAVPGMNGTATTVAVMPHDVVVADPNGGANAQPVTVGRALTYVIGGKSVTLYGYQDSTGAAHWSVTQPWADGVTSAVDPKTGNIQLTLPASSTSDILTRATAIDAKYGTHIVAAIKAGSTNPTETIYSKNDAGQSISGVKVELQNGVLTVTQKGYTYDANGNQIETSSTPIANLLTPQQLLGLAIAPSRLTAGTVPGTTFSSPAEASIYAAAQSLSSDQMTALVKDPTFQQAWLSQTMQTLGTSNPLDPRVVQAWDMTTMGTAGDGFHAADLRTARVAGERADLTFPGENTSTNPAQQAVSVNFGGQSLKLPDVPSYLSQQQVQQGLAGTGMDVGAQAKFLQQFGATLPQVAPPAATPDHFQGVAPTATPTPVVTKTSIAPAPIAPVPVAPVPIAPTSAPAPARYPSGVTNL